MIPASELILRPDGSIYHLGLRPEQIATTILTVGDPGRVARVSHHFDRVDHRVGEREFITHTGELGGRRLSVVSTGIGTDNVDVVLNELDALHNIDLERRQVKSHLTQLTLLRLGTSGAFQPDLPLDSIILSAAAIAADGLLPYYPQASTDEDLSEALSEVLPLAAGVVRPQLPDWPKLADLPRGITLTAAGFYAPQGRQLRLRSALHCRLLDELRGFTYEDLRITNIEMETAGIYALAGALGHRSASLSVLLANRAEGTFSTEPAAAVERLIERGLSLLAG